MEGKANLLHVVGATRSPSCFSGLLHRRQQKANKDADDGNNNKQFDKRKPITPGGLERHEKLPWLNGQNQSISMKM
jgi:hypothetical protein